MKRVSGAEGHLGVPVLRCTTEYIQQGTPRGTHREAYTGVYTYKPTQGGIYRVVYTSQDPSGRHIQGYIHLSGPLREAYTCIYTPSEPLREAYTRVYKPLRTPQGGYTRVNNALRTPQGGYIRVNN